MLLALLLITTVTVGAHGLLTDGTGPQADLRGVGEHLPTIVVGLRPHQGLELLGLPALHHLGLDGKGDGHERTTNGLVQPSVLDQPPVISATDERPFGQQEVLETQLLNEGHALLRRRLHEVPVGRIVLAEDRDTVDGPRIELGQLVLVGPQRRQLAGDDEAIVALVLLGLLAVNGDRLDVFRADDLAVDPDRIGLRDRREGRLARTNVDDTHRYCAIY